jgi:hypothetical protein
MDHRWSEKQVDYRVCPLLPYRMCLQLQETLQR